MSKSIVAALSGVRMIEQVCDRTGSCALDRLTLLAVSSEDNLQTGPRSDSPLPNSWF